MELDEPTKHLITLLSSVLIALVRKVGTPAVAGSLRLIADSIEKGNFS